MIIDLSKVELFTNRLVLTPWKLEYLQDMFEFANDEQTANMAGFTASKTLSDCLEVLNSFIENKNVLAIKLANTGKVIGSIGVHCSKIEQCPDIGFVLSRAHWGQTLVFEAVTTINHYIFNNYEYNYISCYHFIDNTRSMSLIKKIGFEFYRVCNSEEHNRDIMQYILYRKSFKEDYLNKITSDLLALTDNKNKDFFAKLVPTEDKDKILGVKNPVLKEYSKTLLKNKIMLPAFLNNLPHKYNDENMLHQFVLAGFGDYKTNIVHLNNFIPYISNWAVCDSLSAKGLGDNRSELFEYALNLSKSEEVYKLRTAIIIYIKYFCGKNFKIELIDIIKSIKSDEYYINMALAWLVCELVIKNTEHAVSLLEEQCLSSFVQNKAIQKCKESFRISDETKEHLLSLKKRA